MYKSKGQKDVNGSARPRSSITSTIHENVKAMKNVKISVDSCHGIFSGMKLVTLTFVH